MKTKKISKEEDRGVKKDKKSGKKTRMSFKTEDVGKHNVEKSGHTMTLRHTRAISKENKKKRRIGDKDEAEEESTGWELLDHDDLVKLGTWYCSLYFQ
jgi:hypothetical protein